jgi:aminoglycoside phosphotransferase (APT) family kinase protein
MLQRVPTTSPANVVGSDLPTSLKDLIAPLGAVADLEKLTGGTFATTYRATFADGRRVIVKTAPTDAARLLTYERDLVRTEAAIYELATAHPGLLMPKVLMTDFSRTVVPGDVLVVTHQEGMPLTDVQAEGPWSADDESHLQHQLGAYMAGLHRLTGPRFGYPNDATGLRASTWPQAFGRMVEAVLADAQRWDIPVPRDAVRAALHRHRDALAEVREPQLVHTDLWAGNLFVDPLTRRLTGVIDTERSLWGDPILEFAGADELGRGPVPQPLLDGYASLSGSRPLEAPDGETRLLLYRLYIALVLSTVFVPRGFTGPDMVQYRAECEASVAAALDGLLSQ